MQAGTLMVNCRRHRPVWMTRGMLVPTGMSVIVKLPLTSVIALTSGDPETLQPQCTPGGIGCVTALGTYTRTLGSGSVPFGAKTVPVVVVEVPPSHACCWRQRFVQVAPVAHIPPRHAPLTHWLFAVHAAPTLPLATQLGAEQ